MINKMMISFISRSITYVCRFMSLKKIFVSYPDRLLIRTNHGHTWSKLWIYWFLVSLLLSRVTLLFSLHSMGSSTITTTEWDSFMPSHLQNTQIHFLFCKWCWWALQGVNIISRFKLDFVGKSNCPFPDQYQQNTFVQITIYLIFTMEVFTVSLLSQCLYKIIGCNNFMVKLLEAIK